MDVKLATTPNPLFLTVAPGSAAFSDLMQDVRQSSDPDALATLQAKHQKILEASGLSIVMEASRLAVRVVKSMRLAEVIGQITSTELTDERLRTSVTDLQQSLSSQLDTVSNFKAPSESLIELISATKKVADICKKLGFTSECPQLAVYAQQIERKTLGVYSEAKQLGLFSAPGQGFAPGLKPQEMVPDRIKERWHQILDFLNDLETPANHKQLQEELAKSLVTFVERAQTNLAITHPDQSTAQLLRKVHSQLLMYYTPLQIVTREQADQLQAPLAALQKVTEPSLMALGNYYHSTLRYEDSRGIVVYHPQSGDSIGFACARDSHIDREAAVTVLAVSPEYNASVVSLHMLAHLEDYLIKAGYTAMHVAMPPHAALIKPLTDKYKARFTILNEQIGSAQETLYRIQLASAD